MQTTIDKAGRVVIPKALRQNLRLAAGDRLDIDESDDSIVLTPVREKAAMVRKKGIWVFRSTNKADDISIPDLIDQLREERIIELMGR